MSVNKMSKIIFYHPVQLVDNPKKGSEIRPKMMLQAFKNIGYEVETVLGNSSQRKKDIKRVKKRIKNGEQFDFMYAESANITIFLADHHHLPVRPIQDLLFFKFLNKNNIPIGLFYRDIYWRVDSIKNELKNKLNYFKYYTKRIFHYLEWYCFIGLIDHLFLPTISISKYLPTHSSKLKISALYPGTHIINNKINITSKDNHMINAFYVGGVKPPYYDLKPLLRVVSQIENIKLLICCRKEEWLKVSSYYDNMDLSKIEIIHVNIDEITRYYNWADVFLDIRNTEGYLKTAMPIKIIEAIGHNLPLIVLDGSEVANFVKKNNAGWVLDDESQVIEFLKPIRNTKIFRDKSIELKNINSKHTWDARAKKVIEELIN